MGTVELTVARIGRAHGIRGDVALDVRTDEPERRLTPGTVFETLAGRLTVRSTRWHSGRLLVRFDDVEDRTAAEALQGVELVVVVPADERPDDPDEFYDHQVVGLRVLDHTGRDRGEVTGVTHLPAQDLLTVRTGGGDRLVPFVAQLVPHVDLGAGTLTLADVAGLLDESSD